MAFNPLPDLPLAVQLSEMDAVFCQPGIYFLWSADSVVYVGQARQMANRITQHMVEGKKTFDGVSCRPCSLRELGKTERFYIEALLPKYNRCGFSESIRRIWTGHMEERPLPDRKVRADVAAQILGVTVDQLRLLGEYGLVCHKARVARGNVRRGFYVVRELHQFTAQKADALLAVRSQAVA